MALHHSLRELVEVRGAGVTTDSDELRGALDDFLAEDEATLGELNLLVDAVRLGALRRLVDVLDHGAEPAAAVWDAGRALARDRGTDDPARSCWALAALGFALGKVDEAVVHAHRSSAGTVAAPVPPPAAPRPPQPGDAPVVEPVVPAADPVVPATPGREAAAPPPEEPEVSPPTTPVPVGPYGSGPYGGAPLGPVGPVIPEERGGGTWLVVLLGLLVVAGVVVAGVLLLRSGGDDPTDPSTGASSHRAGGRDGEPPAILPAQTVLVPVEAAGEGSRIYGVDLGTDAWEPHTEGGEERLPAISPDRSTITYLRGGTPGTLMAVDVDSAEARPLFPDGPCATSYRPGFSPDGNRIALICTGEDDTVEGIYVATADGSGDPQLVVAASDVRGSPTWVSQTRFVFGRWTPDDPELGPKTLWTVDIEDQEPEQLPTPEGLQATHADWAPGRGVLFLVSEPGSAEVGSIYLMDEELTAYEVLAEGLFSHPAFSPDGSEIVVTTFEQGLDGPEQLAVVSTDPPNDLRIVDNAPDGEVGIPAWGTR